MKPTFLLAILLATSLALPLSCVRADPVIPRPAPPTPRQEPLYPVLAASREALKHKATVIREVRFWWGMEVRRDVFFAQIHQESGWREDARSPVGAGGLAQFMPTTAEFAARLWPKDLQPVNVYDPRWSIRALVRYDKWLIDQFGVPESGDNRLAWMLVSFNGGQGWAKREAAECRRRASLAISIAGPRAISAWMIGSASWQDEKYLSAGFADLLYSDRFQYSSLRGTHGHRDAGAIAGIFPVASPGFAHLLDTFGSVPMPTLFFAMEFAVLSKRGFRQVFRGKVRTGFVEMMDVVTRPNLPAEEPLSDKPVNELRISTAERHHRISFLEIDPLIGTNSNGEENFPQVFWLVGTNRSAPPVHAPTLTDASSACNANLWFNHVERVCLRGAAACRESREYPHKILFRWRPIYAGW